MSNNKVWASWDQVAYLDHIDKGEFPYREFISVPKKFPLPYWCRIMPHKWNKNFKQQWENATIMGYKLVSHFYFLEWKRKHPQEHQDWITRQQVIWDKEDVDIVDRMKEITTLNKEKYEKLIQNSPKTIPSECVRSYLYPQRRYLGIPHWWWQFKKYRAGGLFHMYNHTLQWEIIRLREFIHCSFANQNTTTPNMYNREDHSSVFQPFPEDKKKKYEYNYSAWYDTRPPKAPLGKWTPSLQNPAVDGTINAKPVFETDQMFTSRPKYRRVTELVKQNPDEV